MFLYERNTEQKKNFSKSCYRSQSQRLRFKLLNNTSEKVFSFATSENSENISVHVVIAEGRLFPEEQNVAFPLEPIFVFFFQPLT